MGLLVNGKWVDKWYDTKSTGGRFERWTSGFRNWVTADGTAGPTGQAGFPAESGRYHLYAAQACPWAHRTLIFRKLKGLEPHIGVSVVHPDMLQDGWTFDKDWPGLTGDHLYDYPFLRDIYTRAESAFSGRVTVPVLWDKKTETIVSNESSEIVRMFNSAFDTITGNEVDFYPENLRAEINEVNERIYKTINNGVYQSGFATTQEAYDEAVTALFDTLEWLEARLSRSSYLVGNHATEADWRLFTTLIRFDLVYHLHFKCNKMRLVDFPNLWSYTRELYQWPGVRETIDFDQVVRHYHYSHDSINPSRIIPINPDLDFDQPQTRKGLVA
ncbi:glutathione S-transferase family protein [Roseobacter sp. YSTF-M11]|uniref:Glutathione S-transferase family protein n=1 Tax=Roseobacter insulae TaxID=2859783 RepID=A0A9X1FSZ3_9RHOB|nr:glutathione S-transferase family protein [Roseobacter insulae]MBW4706343.1 glutathione S-transferase family protein [Roseobacter insulae]